MKSKLHIILVNYKGFKDTIECLESIYNSIDRDFQIIIIDNSEWDTDIHNLKAWSEIEKKFQTDTDFSSSAKSYTKKPLSCVVCKEEDLYKKCFDQELLIVKTSKNKGFAAANNVALRYINKFGGVYDLIWLLNNDTVIESTTTHKIRTALVKFDLKKDTILFGTPLLEYNDRNSIQAIGGKYNKNFAITTHVGVGLRMDNNIDTSRYKVDYPIGASMVFSCNFLKRVGLMNEEYFLFFEELDWVQRLKKVGGKVIILPIFGVYHKHGKSTLSDKKEQKSEFIDLLSLKNRMLFSKKFYKRHLWSVKLFILTITILKRIISGNFDRIPKIIKMVIST